MKAYAIAVFLLLIQVSAAIVDYSGVFENNIINAPSDSLNWTKNTLQNTSYLQGTSGGLNYEGGGLFGFFEFGKRVLNVKGTVEAFGMPAFLALLVAIPVYFIWFMAIIQFLWRKGFQDMV